MAQNSRGGGFDLAIEKKQKKAMGTETRQSIGAQIVSRSPGTDPQAPSSIGELMTPSTFGREGPPVDEQDLQRRTVRNEGFLSSPETQAALFQFGVKLLAGASPGNAIASAMGMSGRMQTAQAKLTKAEKEMELDERRVRVQEAQLGIQEAELGQTLEEKKARKAVFGSLKNMSDDQLMEAAAELAAEGDDKGAEIALSMVKSLGGGEGSALMQAYNTAVSQGYKGDIIQFKKDFDSTNTLESIRQKLATGMPLSPGEQAVYNDAIISDPIIREFMKNNPNLFGNTSTTTEPGATGTSGTVNNIPYKVIE